MKKSIMFFSFLLSFVFAITMFSSNMGGVEKASAKSLNVSPQSIIIVGSGEVEVAPDTVQINFGLKSRADDLLSGQTKMKENIDNITKKIQELDKDATVSISFSSSYPINHGGIFGYEVDCCLNAKSSKVESVTELTEAIISSNITNIHNTNYMLTNKEDAYIQALVKAKENADSKARAMFNTATFKGLKEESFYNFCENSKGDKIKVCAKVRAFYEINNEQTENTKNTENTTATNAFEVDQEKTPVSNNKISNETTTKDISNKENILPTTQTENKQEKTLQKEELNKNNTNNSITSASANKTEIENEKTEDNFQNTSQAISSKNQENFNEENKT
ncbi:MAG: SIMPL domain-containing protein [Clostridia bacterium]|nr:SIMPL domain-containing protein [Clostridia bacterium]